jgi:hypothetical protein
LTSSPARHLHRKPSHRVGAPAAHIEHTLQINQLTAITKEVAKIAPWKASSSATVIANQR